jgi:AraC-like DNA-binding protein
MTTPAIAAVLGPGERARVEAAMGGGISLLHQETIPDAIRAVRERPVAAVLLSVSRCRDEQLPELDRLVQGFPTVPTVAVVNGRGDPAALLRLGARGIREVVDVSAPEGWQRLRALVESPGTPATARILGPLLTALGDAPPDARLFFEALVRAAPHHVTVRHLARTLHLPASTLVSRFQRAGLPSPKSYLAALRLLHAALLLEAEGRSVADVAHRLEYSSPQSFGRHVRAMLGVTATEFRRRLPFPVALDRFLGLMIAPYRAAFRTFHPLMTGGLDSGH